MGFAMASMYAARLRNAHRIGNKIKRYLKEGYLIFDNENYQIKSVKYKSRDSHITILINDMFMYMISDPMMANGMEMTVKEYNDQFKNWNIVHPRHFQQL